MKINIKSSHVKNILILLHIFSAIFAFFTFFFTYRLSENLLIQKTLNKQHIIAKAGSLSVENLLKSIEQQLSSYVFSFAKIDESTHFDIDNTRTEFISYIQKTQSPISGIALYDTTGKLLAIENKEHLHAGENQDFSKSDFINWSKNPLNKNKVFISTPYKSISGATTGKTILLLAEPIYFGNAYKGTLAIRILIDEFKNVFIAPLISETDEDTFVLDSKGVLLAGNNNLLNKNLFNYAQETKWNQYKDFIDKLNSAIKKGDMQTAWTFQQPKEKAKTLLAGISRIDIPNTEKDLYMVATTPKESIISLLSSLRHFGIAWLGFGVLTTTIGGLIVIFLSNSD